MSPAHFYLLQEGGKACKQAMVSQKAMGLCYLASTVVLVHAVLLTCQLPLASARRHLQWSPMDDAGNDENYMYQRWKRDVEVPYYDDDDNPDSKEGNCTTIDSSPRRDLYNDSCEFVKEECSDKFELFNYLRLSVCSLGKVRTTGRHLFSVHFHPYYLFSLQWPGFFFLLVWLFYLLLILTTTVSYSILFSSPEVARRASSIGEGSAGGAPRCVVLHREMCFFK